MVQIQWFAYFYEVRKILWILLWRRKNKPKQKAFAKCVAGSSVLIRSALLIALALVAIR